MITPFTPEQAREAYEKTFPEAVIKAANQLIAEHFHEVRFIFKFNELRERAKSIDPSLKEHFEDRWLDIEKIYEEYGWNVNSKVPSYDENWDGYYVFSPKLPFFD